MEKKQWIAQQQWNDVLFLHWPVSPDLLQPFVPKPYTLDLFNNQAWVTAVLFEVRNSRLRGMPKILSYPSFLQLNIRTYVSLDHTPGIFFFTIDTNHSIVKKGARLFSIPYIKSQMSLSKTGSTLNFKSQRNETQFPTTNLSVNYDPLPISCRFSENSLTYWLVERYSFWSIIRKRIYQFRISHKPWKLQEVNVNTSLEQFAPYLPSSVLEEIPLAHYSKSMLTNLYPVYLKGLLG